MCLELSPLKVLRLFLFLCFGTGAMVLQQDHYQSPCPDTFRYQLDQSGELYGTIGVYTLDENVVKIEVELSVGNHVNNYNGRIELAFTKEQTIDDIFHKKPVKYKLYFPRWENIPPKITKIVVNGQVVCTGPPMDSGGWVRVLTTINLQHTLYIKVLPLQSRTPFMPADMAKKTPNDDRFLKRDGPGQIDFKPLPSKDTLRRNPFLNSLTTTTTERINRNSIPANDFYYAKNPFFNGKAPDPPVTPRNSPPPITNPPPTSKLPPISNPPQPSDTCGITIVSNPLVVNGVSVPRGAFPWLAALFSVTTTGLDYKCTGSLISKRHVVTAAHCVEQGRKRIRADRLVLVLGKLNIKRWSLNDGEKMIEAEAIHVHPDYVPLTSDADIAVVVLADAVEFSRYIRPVCLWSESDDLDVVVGEKGKVVGWGRDENNNTMTAEPKQTTVPIVSQEECLRSGEAFKYVTSTRTFCAGERNGGGPCNGDSGGGFVMKRNDRWVLRGVVSISVYDQNTQTCDLSNYVVFTDTSKFKTWLLSFIL